MLKQNLTYYQDADHDGSYKKGGADRLMFQFTNGMTMNLGVGVTFLTPGQQFQHMPLAALIFKGFFFPPLARQAALRGVFSNLILG